MARVHIGKIVVRLRGSSADGRAFAEGLPAAIARTLASSGALAGAVGERAIGELVLSPASSHDQVAPAAAAAIARAAGDGS